MAGMLTIRSGESTDLDGWQLWSKAPRATRALYPGGFTMRLLVGGSQYVAQSSASAAANVTAALGDGNIGAAPLVVQMSLDDDKAAMTPAAEPNLALAIKSKYGIVVGSFIHPVTRTAQKVRGVVLQKQNAMFGFFVGIDETGYLNAAIDPAP